MDNPMNNPMENTAEDYHANVENWKQFCGRLARKIIRNTRKIIMENSIVSIWKITRSQKAHNLHTTHAEEHTEEMH